MAVTNRVADATKNYLYPKLVDTVVTQTRINEVFLKGTKPWGGAQMEIPIKWQTNSNNGAFSGFDTLSTTAVDNTVKMTFDAKFAYQATVLPETDIALNNTPAKVADLLERQVMSDAVDFGMLVASYLYSDGTLASSKAFTGLGAAVDDGTSVATYGGLSRSTYTSLAATVTASSGTLTLAKMYTLWDTVTQGQQRPGMILTTKAIRSLYEQLLVPNVRYANPSEMAIGAGQNGPMFRDVRVMEDSACTTGVMFFLNEKTFQFYAIKDWGDAAEAINYSPESMDGEPSANPISGLGFAMTKWTRPVNQLVRNKFIVLGGNLICDNPRYNGKLTGITSI